MAQFAVSFQLLIVLAATFVSASLSYGIFEKFTDATEELPPEFVTLYYTQTLDHFNYKPESYETFQQRYILNSKYWGGPNTSSPIFVYAGAECNITLVIPPGGGFMAHLASRFNALLLYIEHRFYGESNPFGPSSLQNATTLGYLSSAQALADYAQLILDVKKNLSAESSPVIVVGGSYGGMLASWFRLKYPHIVIGALASSAPILYFDDITPQDGFFVVASKDFKDTSESCYNTIKQSWSEIDKVAAQQNGLETLRSIFSLCDRLHSVGMLKFILRRVYLYSAQYDNPPYFYVEKVCGAINGAPEGTDTLGRIAAGLNASIFSCHSNPTWKSIVDEDLWLWQVCTELVMPIGLDNNNTMFEALPFDMNRHVNMCQSIFGISPRPHWITTEYGGHDIKSVLGNFASNIIFSNGLRDPFSVGGVLEDISDSVVAIKTEKGAHCLDLYTATPNDSDWLVAQREEEINIIAHWIDEYNAKPSNDARNSLFYCNYYLISFFIAIWLVG
ncbi:hypothetical protein JCGZ_13384 [Jatropha curcas]|uniref:Uncharacterized protein n=1 Tax=Jatropha curcas TaxID=180498 RepID=A0A067KKW3_JATCU|nr:lysosomal Pro-X carboxypeptidase [Jatropha curcas]KDP32459.1 hypothetical protein JCGZ_13384 [Jatropha curcas]